MVDAAAGTRGLQCVVVTPERAVVDEQADFVALPLYDGELGVLPDRAPLVGRLGYGELRIRRGTTTQRYFVERGFVQVRGNVVTVLTSHAIKANDIDPTAAQRALDEALLPAGSAVERSDRKKAQDRARAQLTVARHVHAEH
jgi:F-type H+-transporting ATPase subunit epsilon